MSDGKDDRVYVAVAKPRCSVIPRAEAMTDSSLCRAPLGSAVVTDEKYTQRHPADGSGGGGSVNGSSAWSVFVRLRTGGLNLSVASTAATRSLRIELTQLPSAGSGPRQVSMATKYPPLAADLQEAQVRSVRCCARLAKRRRGGGGGGPRRCRSQASAVSLAKEPITSSSPHLLALHPPASRRRGRKVATARTRPRAP
jgi:hypothetical protein